MSEDKMEAIVNVTLFVFAYTARFNIFYFVTDSIRMSIILIASLIAMSVVKKFLASIFIAGRRQGLREGGKL